MGRLKPGAAYVYEHVDGITYAREQGSPVNSRFEIGRTFERESFDKELKMQELWKNMVRESEHNPLLKNAIDKCIMIYHLSKTNGN